MKNHITAAIAKQGEAKTTTAGPKNKSKATSVATSAAQEEVTSSANDSATPVASETSKTCPTSSLSPKEVQDRLQRAARILATGAIRAARQKALEASAKSKTTKASSALVVSAA